MKRLLLIPALASLLAGCVYSDYAYRGAGPGDYYYGQPGVEYRYHGGYYGYAPYGYPYGYGYGYPYYGGYYRYGYPYYGYYPRPHYRPYPNYPYRPHEPRPPYRPDTAPPATANPRPRPGPWHVLDGIDRAPPPGTAPHRAQPAPGAMPARPAMPRASTEGRSSSPIGTLTRSMGEPRRRQADAVERQEP